MTIISGVFALSLGFIAAGFVWLSLDLSRPVPEGVDERERNTQLVMLWWGVPLGVLTVCAAVAGLAILVAGTALSGGLPRH